MRGKKGFTLIELIIVIAILGILAGVLIPVFSGISDSASKKVCEYNIKNLCNTYYADALIYGTKDTDRLLEIAATDMHGGAESMKVTGVCPNGGTLEITISDDKQTIISVTCDHHRNTVSTELDNMAKLSLALKDPDTPLYKYISSLNIASRGSIDYPLPEGMTGLAGWSKEVIRLASESGIDLASGSWRIFKWSEGDYALYYTETNVLEKNVGDLVSVYKWNVGTSDKSNGKSYVGEGAIITKTGGGGMTFNVVPNLYNSQMSTVTSSQ